jgi:hypothetical protein
LNATSPATSKRAAPALVATFLGIPTGLPLVLVLIGLVLLMWMARDPARRVLRQLFVSTGWMFGEWGRWLLEHGRKARISALEYTWAKSCETLLKRLQRVIEDDE